MGASAPLPKTRSRWSLDFVKKLTIFEVSSTGRQGRQPMGASAPLPKTRSRWSLDFVKKLTILEVSSTMRDNIRSLVVAFLLTWTLPSTMGWAREPIKPLAGTNLALGKKATYSLEPNYRYCRGGDEADLTDGRFWQAGGKKGFWTDKGTVGWNFGRKPGALIRFDLGRTTPIDAIGFDTSAGSSQVTFPAAVLVYASDDAQSWHYVSDLINEAIPQSQFVRHRFVARELHTRARHVALYVVKGGFYAFVDEIEIIKGRHDASDVSFAAESVTAADLESDALQRGKRAVQKNATLYLIQAARVQLATSAAQRTATVLDQLGQFEQSAVRRRELEEVDYSAGLPYTELDGDICRAMGEYFSKHSTNTITVWKPEGTLWSHRTNPFARPSAPQPPMLRLDMMIGEYEPVGFNLSNNTGRSVTATVRVGDLRDSQTGALWPKSQLDQRLTTHVLASGYLFFDDALGPVRDGRVVIPAGMTRQVWLIFHSRGVAPRTYVGRVTVKTPVSAVELPLAATVYPVEMPSNPDYRSQAWSYFTSAPAKGHEKRAAMELERCYANAHVLHHIYIPWPKVDKATKRLVRPTEVDFTKLDEMLAYRPYVKQWLLWTGFEFGYMRLNYYGATDMPQVGTPEYETVFKEWIRLIRDHMHEKGFPTDQWAFYWVDEPGDKSFLKYVVPASRLAKSVDPSILVWEDHQVSLKMLEKYPEAIDIHCCPTPYYKTHPDILKHVLAEKHSSAHYVCASSKASDPHRYYRLHHHAAIELGLDGAGMWVWGDDGGQFNDYAGSNTRYGMVYATPDGPMPGKRREAWREGVEDVELWRHLRNAAQESGQAELKRLLKAFGQHNATPEALLSTRREILKALAARVSTQ